MRRVRGDTKSSFSTILLPYQAEIWTLETDNYIRREIITGNATTAFFFFFFLDK